MQGMAEQSIDWILKPIDAVNRLFGKDHSLSNIEEFFKEKLSIDNQLYKVCNNCGIFHFVNDSIETNEVDIPSLNDVNLHSIPSGTLVRFRCMIQDIFDPEVYLALFKATHPATNNTMFYSSKYKEVADIPNGWEIDFDAQSTVTKECQTFYCIPVPAENNWSKKAHKSKSQSVVETDLFDQETSRNSCKRSYNTMKETDITNSMDGMDTYGKENEENKQVERSKASKFMSSNITTNVTSWATIDLLPDGKCCLVKVYDNLDSYHVSEMFEFIGILSVEPLLASHDLTNNESKLNNALDPSAAFIEENIAEIKAHHPPPSLVPRLHCIVAQKMEHSNPLLPVNLKIPIPINDVSELYGRVLTARSSLIDLLTTALMGDKLAAEYTLLNLISTVHSRHGLMALGKFSLNLINPSIGKISSILQKIVQHLLPKSYLLPMSLTNMNALKMTPKKNFESNRLEAGLLQLTAGTHLILDETLLTAGQLNNNGCLNLQALDNILTWQKVKYDFHYHVAEIPCDLPILVLSEGRSLLQVDCNLPVKQASSPDPEILESLHQTPLENLNKLRIYLGLCRSLKFQLTSDVQNKLEQDFVEMRKTDAHMNAELFHFMLDMARLLSTSSGHTELQLDTWQKLKAMEVERRTRLNQLLLNK